MLDFTDFRRIHTALKLYLFLICLPFSGFGKEPPNLILILVDDLGYGDLGMHGSKQIPTPNIDRLGAEGIVFKTAYVSSTVCAPSRAGLLTGKNQLRFGFNNNFGPDQPGFDPEFKGLPLSETTIADRLGELGYTTGLIGKWHLGEKPQFHPLKRGFEEFWGFLGGGHNYFEAEADGEDLLSPIYCNYKTPGPLTYMTDDIGNESVDFIRRHKDSPFFLLTSFNAPHSPMQARSDDLTLFTHIEDELRRTYCAMVYRLDQNVGKMLDALQSEGLEENTLVVFLSDNGGPTVDPIANGSINAPFRGQKTTLLEGGIRVPFIVKWPRELNTGVEISEVVSALDIFPTFVRAAGGSVSSKEELDGMDLLPFLTGSGKTIPSRPMKWGYTVSMAYRLGNWKLIRLPDRLPMLFDLSTDMAETNNLALIHLDRTKAMLQELGDWDHRLPQPLFLEPPSWRVRHLMFYDVEYQLEQPD
ncbi:sulfatase-like hydrolase/transferase [Lunatimonas salinarum]|uniref:sulfatase-like hydrolase/transferase n=1 Tax=Lunatimonas salinarum TaxID=1774590 RepID=UPI001ADF9F2B|nr:sulfatase-like hydrolase/transferase [Lunatimonas salinarum]